MATRIHRNKGEQFLDANGDPLDGGKLFYYRATTLTPQHTFFAADGLIGNANTNPVVLGSDGRLQTPVYLGDSDSYLDYKEILTTSGNVTVDPWPFDNIPAALPTTPATAFAPPLFDWTQTTGPTVNLTAADAGNSYEADSTAGNITFNLPSAASVGNGKGFAFKKAVGANSIIIDPSGSELLDGSSSQYFMGNFMQTKVIASNGAAWFTVAEYLDLLGTSRLGSTFINGQTAATTVAEADEFLMQLAGAGAFRKVPRSILIPNRYITSGTVTSAADLDLTIPADCDEMVISLWNWRPANDNTELWVRFSQSGVFLSGAADYVWGGIRGAASVVDSNDSEIAIAEAWGNLTVEVGHFQITILRPSAAGITKSLRWTGGFCNLNGNIVESVGVGSLVLNTNAIDGVKLRYSTGNISTGFYTVRASKNA